MKKGMTKKEKVAYWMGLCRAHGIKPVIEILVELKDAYAKEALLITQPETAHDKLNAKSRGWL